MYSSADGNRFQAVEAAEMSHISPLVIALTQCDSGSYTAVVFRRVLCECAS